VDGQKPVKKVAAEYHQRWNGEPAHRKRHCEWRMDASAPTPEGAKEQQALLPRYPQ